MPVKEKVRRKKSERGNWLIVTYLNGQIFFCRWVTTWAGVQMSKRNMEKGWGSMYPEHYKIRVFVLDIERMIDFAVTEGVNQIQDLEELFTKE